MKLIYWKLFLVAFSWLLLGTCAVLGQTGHQFRRLTVQQGLSHDNVNCIMQDSRGFLWFGTQDGLCRFDGYSIKKYVADANELYNISDNSIFSLAEDAQGYIWVATNKGLNRFDRKTERFKHYVHIKDDEKSIPNNNVSVVFLDKDQRLWVGTYADGLCHYDAAADVFVRHHYKEVFLTNNTGVLCINQAPDGQMLIGTHSGLSFYNPATKAFSILNKNTQGSALPSSTVYSLLYDDQQNLLVGTSNGLASISPQGQMQLHEQFANMTVRGLEKTAQKQIWVATMNGLYMLANGISTKYSYAEGNPHSIASNEIWTLFTDRQQVLWVGTFGGGVNFTNANSQDFQLYTHDAGNASSISHSSALSFLEDSKGRLWIGTDGGGLNLFDRANEQFKSYQHDSQNANTLTFNTVLGMAEDRQGYLWLGTWANGVDRFDIEKNTFKHYNIENSKLPNNNIWAVLCDSKGQIWLGTIGGGISRYDAQADDFTNYTQEGNAPKLGSNIVWYLYEDKKGRLWAGTNNGLGLYDPSTDRFKMYVANAQKGQSLSNDWVVCIYEDSRNRLWVGTHGGGLNLFDPATETFKVYKEKNGLPNNIILGISEDKQGFLWLSTLNTISKFDTEKEIFINYDQSHGLQDKQFNLGAMLQARNGQFFVGGKGGFNTFYPDKVKGNSYQPPIVITNFKIFDQYVSIGNGSPLQAAIHETESITLRHEQSALTFEFSALNYVVPEQNQYAYMLEGFDKKWNMSGKERSATYTNLDPGTYLLKIKASNNDGLWVEEPKTLRIKILPPWWLTWWAYTIYAIGSIAAVAGIVKWNGARLEREKARLERMVQERTQEILEQKREIQLKNDELQASSEEIYQQKEEIETIAENLKQSYAVIMEKNGQITDSIMYAQTIQQAILPSKKQLEKHFSEYFIFYAPKDIVSGDLYWLSHVQIDNRAFCFVAVVDCTGHGVPGAFMSMIGFSLLNEIVKEKKIMEPAKILEYLDAGLRIALRQEEKANEDGMDVALARIEKTADGKIVITGAGAKRSMYLWYKDEMHKIQSTNRYIGGMQRKERDFEQSEMELTESAYLYLFTDGFGDLFSEQGKRYGSTALLELIKKNAHLPLADQGKNLRQVFEVFKGAEEQRDDITILGLKL